MNSKKIRKALLSIILVFAMISVYFVSVADDCNKAPVEATKKVTSFKQLTHNDMNTIINASVNKTYSYGRIVNDSYTYNIFTSGKTVLAVDPAVFNTQINNLKSTKTQANLANPLTADLNKNIRDGGENVIFYKSFIDSTQGTQTWHFARLVLEAGKDGDSHILVKASIPVSIRLTFQGGRLTNCKNTNLPEGVLPTLGLKIESVGKKHNAFNSYQLQAHGQSTKVDMAKLLKFGFSATKFTAQTVTGLTILSAFDLFNLYLSASEIADDKQYTSQLFQINNTTRDGKPIYFYECVQKSPVRLRKAGNYYQIRIGLENATMPKFSIIFKF